MLTRQPGFFEDMGRHGMGAAWDKRHNSYAVGGTSFKYAALANWQWDQLMWLLDNSIREQKWICACWAFEWMQIQSGGNLDHCWKAAQVVLSNHQEPLAMPALQHLLKYVRDPQQLMQIEHTSWCGFLVGKHFADEAAKKSSKSDLQTKKKLALHFLGNVRTRIEQERTLPSADPYRTAAIAAALGVAVAAAYEGAAYLQWKGTRTTALAE